MRYLIAAIAVCLAGCGGGEAVQPQASAASAQPSTSSPSASDPPTAPSTSTGSGASSTTPQSNPPSTPPTSPGSSPSNGQGSGSSGAATSPPPSSTTTTPTAPSTSTSQASYSPYEGVWAYQSQTWQLDQGPVIDSALNVYGPVIIDANGNYWFEQKLSDCGASTVSGVIDNTGANLAGPFYVLGTNIDDSGECRASVSAITVSLSLTNVLTVSDTDTQASVGPPGSPQDTMHVWTTFVLSQGATPSLAAAAGNWTLFDGSIATITQDGTFTLSDTDSIANIDCVIHGTVTIADPNTNVYTVTGTSDALCTGEYGPTAENTSVIGVFTIDAKGMHGGVTAGNVIMIPLDSP